MYMNMHVPSASSVALPWNVRHVEPVTDARIEAEKAANRGLILDELMLVLKICRDEGAVSGDPRFLDLRIRTVDRLSKLLRLYEPETPVPADAGDVDRQRMVSAAAQSLDELALKMSAGS